MQSSIQPQQHALQQRQTGTIHNLSKTSSLPYEEIKLQNTMQQLIPGSPSAMRKDAAKNDFVHHFNSRNAKIIACFIVAGFVIYHTVLRLTHGIDSCQWLMSDGNFRDAVWQPYGCMMHHYSHVDTRRCLRYMEYWGGKNYFAFIGDSRTQQLYHSFNRQASEGYRWGGATSGSSDAFGGGSVEEVDYNKPSNLVANNLSYNDSQLGLRVQFLWYTYPNKSLISVLQNWRISKDFPSVIVIDVGGWPMKDADSLNMNIMEEFTASITHLVVSIDKLVEKGAKVIWALTDPVNTDKILLNNEWGTLTNEKIDAYNDNALKILRYSKALVWASGRFVAAENIDETPDGYHLGPKTLFHDSQILLNMYCNDNMNYNDATCCSSSEKISKLQLVTFTILGISFVLATTAFILRIWRKARDSKFGSYQGLKYNGYDHYEPTDEHFSDSQYHALTSLAKLALIMGFFFICDRTTMFMKENKYFTQTNFWLPVIYILVLGIFFTEDSTYTKVMHYDQDNETKGWMVLLILVYNMMGASQVVPIYMFVKILYSAFLFLHGWNQFIAYLQRGDYGIVRFLQDLFRLNVMAVLLCLCMNRPYQFYEFIPLISFWTFVVFVSLSIPPRITWTTCETNSLNYLYLILKLVGIFSFTTILYISEVFFEKVFVTRPWKALFVTTDDDIRDWWMRWKIDRYSMPCGMVLALGYHLGRKYKILEDDNHGNLFSTKFSLSTVLFSILGIVGYGVFSLLCRNQLECVEIHSYVTFIPITSYILLRNVSGMLRTRFSTFFAWFGQIWVELLVGQYHIWQGADGHGVLVLVPAYPVGNVLLTALVFACAAHEVRKCTDVLIPYAVPEDWRKALRNVCLFMLVLVPIGINDGMF